MLPIRPGGRRALAQPFIQRGVREGLSASRIFEQLAAGGITFRRTDFLSDVRHYAGRERLVSAVRSVRRDLSPTEALMTRRAPIKGAPKYRYTVEIRVPGRDEPDWRSVASDRRLTRAEIERMATEPSRRYGGWRDEDEEDLEAALTYIDLR